MGKFCGADVNAALLLIGVFVVIGWIFPVLLAPLPITAPTQIIVIEEAVVNKKKKLGCLVM